MAAQGPGTLDFSGTATRGACGGGTPSSPCRVARSGRYCALCGVPDLDDQRAETAQFIRALLYSLRDRRVLLLSHAQNSRLHWPWLTNGRLRPDALQFGPNPAQHITLYGENLCHVRGYATTHPTKPPLVRQSQILRL
ncbi:RNaseH domain-containing protein [Streptomyces sp. NPDC001220]